MRCFRWGICHFIALIGKINDRGMKEIKINAGRILHILLDRNALFIFVRHFEGDAHIK